MNLVRANRLSAWGAPRGPGYGERCSPLRCSIQADRQALPSGSHAERPVQGSRRQEYWAADAGGPRAEQVEREPIERVRARLEALVRANAAPRCAARSKRTGKPCRAAAMPNGRCKLHGGKSTGPRTPEGLERSRRANWKHGHFSREAKAERSRVRAAMLTVRYLRDSI